MRYYNQIPSLKLIIGAVLVVSFLLPNTAHARGPSLRRVIKDIGYKGVIKCKFQKGARVSSRGFRIWWERGIECKLRGGIKGKPRIKKMTSHYVTYLKSGRRYSYSKAFHNGTTYIGLSTPKVSLVINLIKADSLSFIGSKYKRDMTIGDLMNLKIAKKPKWKWPDINMVWVNFEGTLHEKSYNFEVKKIRYTRTVYLKRKSMSDPWRFTSVGAVNSKVLSKKKYSRDEFKKLKTITDRQDDLDKKNELKKAKAFLASLPHVKIPKFKSAKELLLHTYQMMRTLTPKQMEYYLRSVLSKRYFKKGSTLMMSRSGEHTMRSIIKRALSGTSKFKNQYCTSPWSKLNSSMSFWNKNKSASIDMHVTSSSGIYKLNSLTVHMLTGKQLTQMKSKCPPPLSANQKALRVPKATGGGYWQIGDKVLCFYKKGRRRYRGIIGNIKGINIFIKYNDGDKEWTTAKYCKSQR
jgi:hypothetical protein